MKHMLLIASACALLSGCSSVEESTRDMRYRVDTEYDKMRYKLSDYMYDRKDGPPEITPPRPYYKASYCYQVAGDVVCYREPRHELRGRFLAMQGDDGSYYADMPIYDPSGSSKVHSHFDYHKGTAAQPKESGKKSKTAAKKDSANVPIDLMAGF